MNIELYTDGSCHTQLLIGAWAVIIFIDSKKIVLNDWEPNTTHNRMELTAVIKGVDYVNSLNLPERKMQIFSDSQYVVNLLERKEKLKRNNFITKKGTPIQNVDLVKYLIHQIESNDLTFIKVKAHQKNGDVNNKEVDKIVRNCVREKAAKHG